MTEKDLRKLNRYQLLELLIIQTERADKLQEQLELTEKQLEEQDIKISALGSIADASLELEGIFESAQNAADTYIKEAKKRAEAIENAAKKRATLLLAQAKLEARKIKRE